MFQSPSLRGSGRFRKRPLGPRRRHGRVSIPFIAGQWSLRGGSRGASRRRHARFNPLHCGAVVASSHELTSSSALTFQSPSLRGSGRFQGSGRSRRGARRVSIPFIAGQWSLLGKEDA